MAMTPMQFAKKYKLLEINKVPDETGLANRYKFQVKVKNLAPIVFSPNN